MVSFLKRHKLLGYSLLGILALALLLGLWLGYRSIGPYRSYRADMMKPAEAVKVPIRVAIRSVEIISNTGMIPVLQPTGTLTAKTPFIMVDISSIAKNRQNK